MYSRLLSYAHNHARAVHENLRNGAGVETYRSESNGGVTAILANGEEVHGDVLIGADGIWSKVRATMNSAEPRDGSAYSGYTVFAGELEYGGGDPECGYKVYIGPNQYFVITDIGRGRYQWYVLAARSFSLPTHPSSSSRASLPPLSLSPLSL